MMDWFLILSNLILVISIPDSVTGSQLPQSRLQSSKCTKASLRRWIDSRMQLQCRQKYITILPPLSLVTCVKQIAITAVDWTKQAPIVISWMRNQNRRIYILKHLYSSCKSRNSLINLKHHNAYYNYFSLSLFTCNKYWHSAADFQFQFKWPFFTFDWIL